MKIIVQALEKIRQGQETPVVQAFRLAIHRKKGNH